MKGEGERKGKGERERGRGREREKGRGAEREREGEGGGGRRELLTDSHNLLKIIMMHFKMYRIEKLLYVLTEVIVLVISNTILLFPFATNLAQSNNCASKQSQIKYYTNKS